MWLTFTEEVGTTSDYFKLSGKSSVNLMGGEFSKLNNDKLAADLFFTTNIKVNDEDAIYEEKFRYIIDNELNYKLYGDFLVIEAEDYQKEPPYPIEKMVFKKS